MPARGDQDNALSTLLNLVRMYFGSPAPLSAEGTKRLVDTTAAAARRRCPSSTCSLKEVIRFCSDLKERNPQQLADILGAEDASRMWNY